MPSKKSAGEASSQVPGGELVESSSGGQLATGEEVGSNVQENVEEVTQAEEGASESVAQRQGEVEDETGTGGGGEADEDRDDEDNEEVVQEGRTAEDVPEGSQSATQVATTVASNGDWSAVWSPEANAYYFWNQKTGVTSWTNPLENDGGADASTSTANIPSSTHAGSSGSSTATYPIATRPEPTSADLGGIDPDLAYLDPNLSRLVSSSSSSQPYFQKGVFNARTGRFQADPGLTPDRLSEGERERRQANFYFDENSWRKLHDMQEEEKAKRRSESGADEDDKRPKKLSKKEVEHFKQRNKEKKEAKKRAWLAS